MESMMRLREAAGDVARITVLGSGSRGNAILVETGSARFLVDAGFSQSRLLEQLGAAGCPPDSLDAVIITHAHRDHYRAGTVRFCEVHGIPLGFCRGAERVLAERAPRLRELKKRGLTWWFDRQRPFSIGTVQLRAFEPPHDAPGGNVGLRFEMSADGEQRCAVIATDLGAFPEDCLTHFAESDLIILESNHDEDLFCGCGRPPDVIERILGDRGHLSNRQCAAAIKKILASSRPGTVRQVALAHLSQECNRGDLALREARCAVEASGHPIQIALTAQKETTTMWV